MILSSCVSRFLHLLWRVMISLTLWLSLSGFEGTHLFSNIEVHLYCILYLWCSSLLSCLFWEVFFLTPRVTSHLKQVKVVQSWLPDSPGKILIVILHIPHCWFPQGKKHECLDETLVCNYKLWEKLFGLKPAHCGSSSLYSYIWKMLLSLLAFFLQMLALGITILQCIWGL